MGQHRMECAVGQIVHPWGRHVVPVELDFFFRIAEGIVALRVDRFHGYPLLTSLLISNGPQRRYLAGKDRFHL
ncbi:hypothetical protein D3C81_1750680 [compost metagenome]